MDQDEWVTYHEEEDLDIWMEKHKPSQVLNNTSSSKVCGIAISVPVSSNTLNNNAGELEEEFESLTSQKDDMRLLHVEEQATTVLVSTDKLLLKVNSHHVDAVWRGLIMNLHQGQFGQKVHRVEVSLAADMNKMKTDYVICVYNQKLTAASQTLNGNDIKKNNNDPATDRRNVVRNKNDKKEKIKKPCKSFNEGSCNVATAHPSKSRLTRWLHICRFCFEKYGDEKPHPEIQCEYKKNAAHESLPGMTRSADELVGDENDNIMENKEGSNFTVVASNVYPSCSCRSGCNSKACNCIKFSQECLPSCGCGQACANMGLTRGEGKQVRIGQSTIQGDGCFAEEDIGKGEYVGEYTGEIVLRADQLKKKNPSKFLFEIGHNDFLLDAENKGSSLAKMNHKTEKRGANCVYKLKRAKGEWRVGVWAIKNINKDQELFANYSNNYRGHGLFTPTKKKNKKGRRQGAKVEVKESQRPLVENRKGAKDEERENERPLDGNQEPQSPSPATFISNATKISHEEIKSSPIIKRRTRRLVSMENSVGASSLNDPSTPTHVVGSRAISETGMNSSLSNQPRVMLDSLDKTTQNQSLDAQLPIARTTKKLFEENVKSNPNVATKIVSLNANKENVCKPTVTIAPKEKDVCKGKLYKKLCKENVCMPTVTITHKENNICKEKLYNNLSEENVKTPNLNANKENVPMPTGTITPKEKDSCKGKIYKKMSKEKMSITHKGKLYNELPEENVESNSNVAAKMPNLIANKENVPMPTVTIMPKEKDILYDSVTPLRSPSNIKIIPMRSSPRMKAKVDYKSQLFLNPGDTEQDIVEEERT